MSFQDIGRAAMRNLVGSSNKNAAANHHPSVSSSSRKQKHRSHDATTPAAAAASAFSHYEDDMESKDDDRHQRRLRQHSSSRRKSEGTSKDRHSSSRSSSSRRESNGSSTSRQSTTERQATTGRRHRTSKSHSSTQQQQRHQPSERTLKTKNRVHPIAASHNNNNNNSTSHNKHQLVAAPTRGVRPRLDHLQCPVSEKKLMDDITTEHSRSVQMSVAEEDDDDDDDDDSTTTAAASYSLYSLDDEDDDGWSCRRRTDDESGSSSLASECLMNPRPSSDQQQQQQRRPRSTAARHSASTSSRSRQQQQQQQTVVARARGPSKKNPSQFAQLSTEIVQFQKMVSELEKVLEQASSSPEAMWRSRILMRSAQDSQRDLQRQVHQVDFSTSSRSSNNKKSNKTNNNNNNNAAILAAQQKLQRDWNRAQQHFHKIVMESQRRQMAEMSLLGAKGDDPYYRKKNGHLSSSYPMLGEEKEDFFDRAMRERQEEVERLSRSMNQINDIYTDLAGMVDAQQEQIDKLEDINEDTKTRTKAGLEHIQYTMWNMCASTEAKGRGSKDDATSPVMWNVCAGKEHGSRSFDDTKNMPPNPHDPFTNAYGGPQPRASWKIPQDLESLKGHVQDSANGAYTIGQALVEDLIEQVDDVARSNNVESPRKGFQQAQRKLAQYLTLKNLSCTPDLQTFGTMEDDTISMNDHHSIQKPNSNDVYYGFSHRNGETKEYEY